MTNQAIVEMLPVVMPIICILLTAVIGWATWVTGRMLPLMGRIETQLGLLNTELTRTRDHYHELTNKVQRLHDEHSDEIREISTRLGRVEGVRIHA